MKNWVKKLLIVFGIIFGVVLLANFGINIWLKKQLPNFIKNNSDYVVNYKALEVDVVSGNVFSTGISVKSKNPDNTNVIGLDGVIDSLKVSRLGIYDALINKKISSSDISMVNPNLKITLAKPVDDKTQKKRNPLLFEDISIKNGNINIFRHTKQKYIAVNDLGLNVSNLQMTEESLESKLPIVFDEYDIQGKNFYFRPDDVYEIKAGKIETKNGQMSINQFELIPLVTPSQFMSLYPNKKSLFDVKTDLMSFKDIVLNDNKVTLSKVHFENPKILVFNTNAPQEKKDKSFKYDVNLDDVSMKNAMVNVFKANQTKSFSSESLNLKISNLKMDEETAKGNVPFQYENFKIDGKNTQYETNTQNFRLATFTINQKSGDFRNIIIKPIAGSGKSALTATVNQINFKLNEWGIQDNKLKLDAQSFLINGLNGVLRKGSSNPTNKKSNYNNIEFPLTLKNFVVQNSNFLIDDGKKPLSFKNFNAKIQNIEMNSETVKSSGLPFKTGNYTITTKNFVYGTQFYNLSAGLLKFKNNDLQINDFKLKPKLSKAQFIRSIRTEKDYYDLQASQIKMTGNWDLISKNKSIDASQLLVSGLVAQIFRSKVPPDDKTIKPMYAELLRKIKFPMVIKNLDIKNSRLIYEEDTKASDGPGKLVFGNFNLNAKNLNSGKNKGVATAIPITVNCRFMDTSPMKVNWRIDTASKLDDFTIVGNISQLPAARINAFVEPYLKVRVSGAINDLDFNFAGNKLGLNGAVKMKHQNLQVSVLNKEGGKNKVLSAIANMVVKTDSKPYPESVVVDKVIRDPSKSFFNLFWQGIQEGLKKTLIGENIEKTEQKVKNTIEDAKNTSKDAKSAVKEVKEKTKSKDTPEKKKDGFFKKMFKKKEKTEN